MATGQFWSEDAIAEVLIATDVEDGETANALVQMLLSFNTDPRCLDESMSQPFRFAEFSNEVFVLEFHFSRDFEDRLCPAEPDLQ